MIIKKNLHFDIHHAVLKANYKKVEDLLKNKVSPNKQTGNKNTPLHIAAMQGNILIIELLKNYSADPNLQNLHGSTPLHIASYKKNNLKAIKLLLDMGADANKIDRYGNTALHIAVRSHGEAKTIMALVEAGADRLLLNNESETAFLIAKKNGYFACMKLLQVTGPKFRRSMLLTLKQSFYHAKMIKKILLISFSLTVLAIAIAASIATSGKTFAGILFAMLASLGMALICLEE